MEKRREKEVLGFCGYSLLETLLKLGLSPKFWLSRVLPGLKSLETQGKCTCLAMTLVVNLSVEQIS